MAVRAVADEQEVELRGVCGDAAGDYLSWLSASRGQVRRPSGPSGCPTECWHWPAVGSPRRPSGSC